MRISGRPAAFVQDFPFECTISVPAELFRPTDHASEADSATTLDSCKMPAGAEMFLQVLPFQCTTVALMPSIPPTAQTSLLDVASTLSRGHS